jgi:hypothetical protein
MQLIVFFASFRLTSKCLLTPFREFASIRFADCLLTPLRVFRGRKAVLKIIARSYLA